MARHCQQLRRSASGDDCFIRPSVLLSGLRVSGGPCCYSCCAIEEGDAGGVAFLDAPLLQLWKTKGWAGLIRLSTRSSSHGRAAYPT